MFAFAGWVAMAFAILATCVLCVRPRKREELPGAVRAFAIAGAGLLQLSGSLHGTIALLARHGLDAASLQAGFWIGVVALVLLPALLPPPQAAEGRPRG